MSKKQNILIIHRYFWPDTPAYATYLRHIARALSDSGFNVRVFSTKPSYTPSINYKVIPKIETLDGFTVNRISIFKEKGRSVFFRIFNIVIYFLSVLFVSLKYRDHTIMVATTPPIVGGFAVYMASFLTNNSYIYHYQDIHPEVAATTECIKKRFIFNFLQKLDTLILEKSLFAVVLSQDMKKTLYSRHISKQNKIHILNNFELVNPVFNQSCSVDSVIRFSSRNKKLRLLYAGNIGRFQGLDFLLDSIIRSNVCNSIELILIGEGDQKKRLMRKSGVYLNKSIFFYNHQPIETINTISAYADLCVVSLLPSVINYAFPSKVITYLCAGSPILAVIEDNSDLSKDIKKYNLGYSSPPNDFHKLVSIFEQCINDTGSLSVMKKCALDYANSRFRTSVVLPKWVELFNSVITNNEKHGET